MPKECILVIEDEQDIAELMKYNLEREGYVVYTAGTGERGLQDAGRINPDLVILDLMLPGIDGLEVCRRLKQSESTRAIPVVMVTAKGEDSDVITGLELGADDYVTKPFSPRVLIARVRSLLRRKTGEAEDAARMIDIHGISIDPLRHEIRLDGLLLDLSSTEFSILEFLAANPGWVFSRNQIIDGVKGKDYPVTERSVDVQILSLRKKLGERGSVIQTVRGVGYKMTEEKS